MDQLTMQPDTEDLESRGALSKQAAQVLLNQAPAEHPVGYASLEGVRHPVYVQSGAAERFSAYEALNTPIVSQSSPLYLRNLFSLQVQRTMPAIHKEDRQYLRRLSFEYLGSYTLGSRFLDETLESFRTQVPDGYTAKRSQWGFGWRTSPRSYGLLMLLLVVVYAIASILFESLRLPLVILLSIPVSYIGLFLTFSVFDLYFDQGGFAAFVMIGGLTVNASLLVVWQMARAGGQKYDLLRASASQARTIVLTSLTTAVGLAPFLWVGGSEVFWFAFAAGTLGGLLFSTLSAMVLVPAFLIGKPGS
jgi:multidrug efflux pump subunit AcrB